MQKGFSLIEVIVVTAAISLLFSLVSVNLLSATQQASITTTIDTLLSDIRTQQLKAMVGDTEGAGGPRRYGVHFDNTSYTFFSGAFYNAADPNNFTVELPETLTFSSVTFPSDDIIFEEGSGEIVSFIDGQDSITFRNTETNEERTIELNRLGTYLVVE